MICECILISHDEQDHGHQGPFAWPQDDALRVEGEREDEAAQHVAEIPLPKSGEVEERWKP